MITIEQYQEALKTVQDYEKSLESSKQEIASILEEACEQRNLTYQITLTKEEWISLANHFAKDDRPIEVPIKLNIKRSEVKDDSPSKRV